MPFQLPSSVVSVGHYHQRPGFHPNPNRTPAGLERVELMTGGRGWVEHGGEWVEVLPGHLIWQVEGDWTIGRSDFGNPYRCLSIAFSIRRRPRGRPVRRITEWPDLAAVRAFTDELVRLWVEKAVPEPAFIAYAYGRLLMQALLGETRLERAGLPAAVRRAREAIEAGFAGRLTVAGLAAEARCSVPYLHELFKAHLGRSPHQMILDCRLKEAARRLSSTSEPIKQIARETGFSHAAALCHAFRRYAGLTPAEYRRRSHAAPGP